MTHKLFWFRYNIAPGYCLDLLENNKVYLPVVPFNIKSKSPYAAAENIRHVIYTASASIEKREKVKCKEFDVSSETYWGCSMEVTPKCEICEDDYCQITFVKNFVGQGNYIETFLNHVTQDLDEDFIIAFKKCCTEISSSLESTEDFTIIILTLCLWSKQSSKLTLRHISAFIISFLLSIFDLTLEKVFKHTFVENNGSTEWFNLDLMNSMASWQTIFLSLIELNAMCGSLFPTVEVSQMLPSNTQLQKLYYQLHHILPNRIIHYEEIAGKLSIEKIRYHNNF